MLLGDVRAAISCYQEGHLRKASIMESRTAFSSVDFLTVHKRSEFFLEMTSKRCTSSVNRAQKVTPAPVACLGRLQEM